MSLAGGGFAATVGTQWVGAAFADPQEPDLIVYNAKVQTVDNAMVKVKSKKAAAKKTTTGSKAVKVTKKPLEAQIRDSDAE